MKESLHPGLSKVRRIVVDRDRTISFMGEEGRVYGTPELGRDIEHACRDLLLDYAQPGEDSVGIEIALRHTAPTLPGMEVEITVTVAAVEGRKISFNVSAKDELEPIGGGIADLLRAQHAPRPGDSRDAAGEIDRMPVEVP